MRKISLIAAGPSAAIPALPLLQRSIGVDIAKVHKQRTSTWAIVIAGGALAAFIGLAAAGSALSTAMNAEARVPAAQGSSVTSSTPANADIAPATLAIVPSPVIDPNPVFFFGTGDGSNGYYAEHPTAKPVTGMRNTASNAD